MNTIELIKDACLFGGTVPNERVEEVREFLDKSDHIIMQIKKEIIELLENLPFWDTCPQKYKDRIPSMITALKKGQPLPSDKEVKKHIETLPYYGSCTTEYNEGFENGVEWLKQKIKSN